jgi:uncharacterized metal-binding protein YceD (DUF177 family)
MMYFQPQARRAFLTLRSTAMTAAQDTRAPRPEFSRPAPVGTLGAGAEIVGEADAAERAALARRYDVPAVRSLRFTAAARPWGPGGWRIVGRVSAELTQTCVVTLEPVDTRFEESFERFLAPAERLEAAEELLDPEADEAPEPLGESIDFGEIAAEAAALAIDPYPRRPDAAFDGAIKGPPGVAPMTDEDARPFARLAALKDRDGA